MQVITDVGYLLASFSFIIGLKLMSSPQKAKKGNRIATIGMGIALITVLIGGISKNINYTSLLILSIAILAGVFVGRKMAFTVKMTAMPQMVSLLNATGGGCAMLLGYIETSQISEYLYSSSLLLLNLGVVTGAIALSGSIVAYLKLGGKIRDLHQGGVHWFSRVLFLCIVLLPLGYFLQIIPWSFYELTLVLIFIGLLYGVLFVMPIGGADMPVVISLLNSITGVATALAGLLYANKAMIAGGIFVGAAGIFLTMLMCKAMNRSLWRVIVGNTGSKTQNIGGEASQEIRETSVSEVVTQLLLSKKIGIVPGYGMAVAQAQHTCAQLQNLLQNKGKTLDYIIHPVAGRMPGHMNVLLAEAKIGYHYLKEMHEVNDEMGSYDIIFVIGANDVVNPAAETNPASPIYGMPIIKSHLSKQVVVFKRSMKPGYSGVSNDLFEYDNCQLLFGDAQVSLQEIVTQLKALN